MSAKSVAHERSLRSSERPKISRFELSGILSIAKANCFGRAHVTGASRAEAGAGSASSRWPPHCVPRREPAGPS